jgi:uncharacterized protein YceK
MKKYLPLLLLVVLLAGCASMISRETPDSAKIWRHEIQVARLGLQRGVPWGTLYYRGRELPDYFDSLVIGATGYRFLVPPNDGTLGVSAEAVRAGAATSGGYQVDSGYTPATSASSVRIGAADLDRGWYLAGPHQRKQGTPDSWVWVKRQNLEAFLDPSAVGRFAQAYRLSSILRGGAYPQQRQPDFDPNLGISTRF